MPARSTTPPGFRTFWTGEAISGFGSYITLLALQTLVVLDLDGGATQTGWLSAARWLPYLALGLVVGALVDRVRRRPIMIVSDLARVVLLAVIPISWALGVLSFSLVLLVVAVFGAASLVNDAASQSFMPRLVPAPYLQEAHARIDGADAVGQTVGPALGGVLVRLLGAPMTIAISAFGYVASAIAVARLRTPEPAPIPRRSHPIRALRSDIAAGVRWVYQGSGLRTLAVTTHVWFAANAALGVVVAPFALRDLGLNATAFGLAAGATGLGGVLGAATSTWIGHRLGTGGTIIAAHVCSAAGALAMAAALLAPSATSAAVVLAAGQLLFGFALTVSNSHEMAFRQTLTPDDLQARTNTTMRSFNRAVVVLVAPIAGVLADLIGLGVMLLIAATIFAGVALALVITGFGSVRLGNLSPPEETAE